MPLLFPFVLVIEQDTSRITKQCVKENKGEFCNILKHPVQALLETLPVQSEKQMRYLEFCRFIVSREYEF